MTDMPTPAFPAEGAPSPEMLADVNPMQIATFFGSAFTTSIVLNDVMIVMQTVKPAFSKTTGAQLPFAIQSPVCAWQMSIQALKDLSLNLQQVLNQYEADKGVIETELTRSKKRPEKNSE